MRQGLNPLHCQTCSTRSEGVFCDLIKPQLETMDQAKTANQYKANQVVFYEGNQPYGVFCISEGKIKIYKTDVEGHQQIVRLAGAGDILGYRALLSGEPYEATAETLEPATACFFDKTTFFKILETHPTTAFNVMGLLAKDLGTAEKHSLSLTHKNLRERLAELLLIFKARYGKKVQGGILIDISLKREEFGALIGATPESVIRTISEFRSEGLISVNGRTIIILDPQKMISVANLAE